MTLHGAVSSDLAFSLSLPRFLSSKSSATALISHDRYIYIYACVLCICLLYSPLFSLLLALGELSAAVLREAVRGVAMCCALLVSRLDVCGAANPYVSNGSSGCVCGAANPYVSNGFSVCVCGAANPYVSNGSPGCAVLVCEVLLLRVCSCSCVVAEKKN